MRPVTLDPRDADGWDRLRSLGHDMLGDVLSHLQTLRQQPAWRLFWGTCRMGCTAPVVMYSTAGCNVCWQKSRPQMSSKRQKIGLSKLRFFSSKKTSTQLRQWPARIWGSWGKTMWCCAGMRKEAHLEP